MEFQYHHNCSEQDIINRTFGSIDFEGKELILLQDPYLDTLIPRWESGCYRADAIDLDENSYRIIWEIENADCDDESDACDWDKPAEIFKN